jgi:uncharacterized protein (TIGR00290 family)
MEQPERGEPYAVIFSGGKDSMLALDRATRQGYTDLRLVTLYDEPSRRVRFHGVPVEVMRAQAEALGLPMRCVPTSPATFEAAFLALLGELAAEGVRGAIFGNIHLGDVRAWYEERVRAAGLEHVEPLWSETPSALVRESVARGYRSLLTCVDTTRADPAWLGQPLTEALIAAFERAGIDACGERGEYHTLVTDGPLFRRPLTIQMGEVHVEAPFHQLDVREATA